MSQSTTSTPDMFALYWRLMRPRQWTKNAFVFVGLIFGHAWFDNAVVRLVMLAFVAFCLASSAIYILNDYVDRFADRRHPKKSARPLASGRANPAMALTLGAVCVVVAGLIATRVSISMLGILAAYLGLNVAYTFVLKKIPVVDVFAIALGFVLRLLAGTVSVGIEPSSWLILCGLLVTLFLGFAKRRAECQLLEDCAGAHRKVLDEYSGPLLDHLVSITAGATIVTYALYTVSPHVIAMHGTTRLVYSVPFAIYGMFRYLLRIFRSDTSGDPGEDLLGDMHILAATVGWSLCVLWALNWR